MNSNARLVVDLDAFARNLAVIRATVAPAEHMLVVKNDAYGHGLAAIVQRAQSEGVRWFGAFDVRTGLAVRELVGDDARIFVWQLRDRGEVLAAVEARLDLGVGDAGLLELVADVARDERALATVHLKIDTGLHRNGIRAEDWPSVVARAAELCSEQSVDVVGVWSHIAEASDEQDDEARTAYEAAVATATDAGLDIRIRHLAASAAAFARPEYRYDLVRIGAFAYGIRPSDGPSDAVLGTTPVGSLVADVVACGDEVRVGIGALDGLPSTLAERFAVRTSNGDARVLAIDETSIVIASDRLSVGDSVTVYGADAPSGPTDLAEQIDSIGEEIAVRLSRAIERVTRG